MVEMYCYYKCTVLLLMGLVYFLFSFSRPIHVLFVSIYIVFVLLYITTDL